MQNEHFLVCNKFHFFLQETRKSRKRRRDNSAKELLEEASKRNRVTDSPSRPLVPRPPSSPPIDKKQKKKLNKEEIKIKVTYLFHRNRLYGSVSGSFLTGSPT